MDSRFRLTGLLQAQQATALRVAVEMKLFDAAAAEVGGGGGGEVRIERLAAATGADEVLTGEFLTLGPSFASVCTRALMG